MTFTHEEIRARLVDYLYGQLDGDARAAFRAHLEACDVCRAEVTGAERARAVAREVVRRPLADAVPERARARAFEAARAAVAARAVTGPASAKAAGASTAASARSPASPSDGQGWFGRLRRRWTWTFPTFATFAAVAVFLLVRATIFREAKTPVSAERVRKLAEPETRPGAGRPVDDEDREKAKSPQPPRNVDELPGAEAEAVPPAASGARRDDVPRSRLRRAPATGGARHGSPPILDQLSSTSSSRGAGVASPAEPPAPQKADLPAQRELGGPVDEDRPRGRLEKELPQPSNSPRLQSGTTEADRESANAQFLRRAPAAPGRDLAAPPPPAAVAPAPSAPSPKGKAAAREAAQDDTDVASAPAAARAPDARASDARAPDKKASKKSKAPIAPVAAPDKPPTPAGAGHSAGGAAPDPALARGSRAESLMNQRRWGEAITILRELLRQYPSHPAAARWRALLEAAQAGLDAPEQMFATPPPPR